MLRPLEMEPENRNAPRVPFGRINFAIAAFVRDHLSPAREMNEGAVIPAGIFLEFLPVASAGQSFEAGESADTGHLPSAAEFDVITAREIHFAGELLLVKPPRRVQVHARRTIFVVRRAILQRRDLTAHTAANGVHKIAPNFSAAVGQPVRELMAL